jgi:Zn-dependent protease with chaperone function
MRLTYLLTFGLLALLITACAQPKVQLPEVSMEEVEAEKSYQTKHLYEQDFTSLYQTTPSWGKAEKRLGKVNPKVGPAAIKLCNELRLRGDRQSCVFDVVLVGKKEGFNAYADGNEVAIGIKMLELLDKDEQLAFIIAHELAHNLMNHRTDKLQNAIGGILLGAMVDVMVANQGENSYGGFAAAGATAGTYAYSQSYEHEADYVALYILARAGYDIDKAPAVWRKMAALNPDNIRYAHTHPTTAERFVYMRKAIEEIKAKRKSKSPLKPNFLAKEGEGEEEKS